MSAFELLQPFYQNSVQVKHNVLNAAASLYRGNLVMNVITGSNLGAITFTRAGYAAGALLLGFPRDNYLENAAGVVSLTRPSNMLFHRGCPFEASGRSGDAPTTANLGGLVSMYDESTVCVTPVAGDLKVTLLEILPSGKFLVQLP